MTNKLINYEQEFGLLNGEVTVLRNKITEFRDNFSSIISVSMSCKIIDYFINKYLELYNNMNNEQRQMKESNKYKVEELNKKLIELNNKYRVELNNLNVRVFRDFILELLNRSAFINIKNSLKTQIMFFEKDKDIIDRYNIKMNKDILLKKIELLAKFFDDLSVRNRRLRRLINERENYKLFVQNNFSNIISLLSGVNLELFCEIIKILLNDCNDSFFVILNILSELDLIKTNVKQENMLEMIEFHEQQIIKNMLEIINIITKNNDYIGISSDDITTLNNFGKNKNIQSVDVWKIIKDVVQKIISKYSVDVSQLSIEEKSFYENCKNYSYIPSIHKAVERIIAIGDLHGDYEIAIKTLKLAGVIYVDEDKRVIWIGGKTYVIQTGDQIDFGGRGILKEDKNDDVKILKLFTDLHNQAIKVGGAVISLFGNHELMNVIGIFDFVSPEGITGFNKFHEDGKLIRKSRFQKGNRYSEFLGCTRLSMVLVGSNLFVHAGITKEFLKNISNGNIEEVNSIIRRWVLNLLKNPEEIDNIFRNILPDDSESSVFWTRYLSNLNVDGSICERVSDSMNLIQYKNIIVGHTIQNNGINKVECGESKIIRIDVGLSQIFGQNKIEILEILNDNKFNVITTDGKETKVISL
jgi:hypothetical protein